MIDRRMIENIVREVLAQREKTRVPVLYIVQEKEPDRKMVERLEDAWIVKWINPQRSEFPEDMDNVFFPEFNQDLLVKGAIGLMDTVMSKWLARLLRQEANVYVRLEEELAASLERTGPYASHLKEYAARLELFSVTIAASLTDVRPEEAADGSPALYTGPLITEDVIGEWRLPEIHVPRGTIITPLARDAAKERGITFLHK